MDFTKEELKNRLKEGLNISRNKFSDEEIDLILDYHLLERTEKLSAEKSQNLKELYEKRISSFTKNFLYKDEITDLVSCISLAPNNIDTIEEIPILKTLRIFKNIKTIHLLHTKESEIRIKELEEYLNSKNILIKKYEIDSDNLDNINNSLKKLTNGLSQENTLFDLTLGMKMAGVALYKSAVETGIKAINWIDFQFPSFNKTSDNKFKESIFPKRIPLMTKITLMKEPLRENQKIYSQISTAFKNYDFNLISTSYNSLGQEDKAFFFRELSKFINYSIILSLDSEKFYDDAKIFLDKIFKYTFEEDTKSKIKNFVINLAILSEVCDDKILEFGITQEDLDYYKENILEEDIDTKKMIFYLLISEIIESTYGFKNMDIFIKGSLLEKIFGEDFSFKSRETFAKNIFYYYYDEFPDENYPDKFEELKNIFNLKANFMKDRKVFVHLKDNILTLENFDIRINLLECDELKKYFGKKRNLTKSLLPIEYLLKKEKGDMENMESLNVEDFLFILNNSKTKEESTFTKEKSNISTFIKILNNIVRQELEARDLYSDEDLLIFYPKNIPSLVAENYDSKVLEINDYFLKI